MALLLHVLTLVLLSGGSAEVVEDFEKKCGQFFANGKSPTRFPKLQRYEQICQTLNGVPYYATYYDTKNRIPVYSAYRFEGLKNCTRQNIWYIEPQLDDNNGGPNMALSRTVKYRGKHQALNKDYGNSGYDRGHLAPVYLAGLQSCAEATFTLTNAAPQNSSFNSGQWRVLEERMADELVKQCLNLKYSVFIVTGVVPGTETLKNETRVNVPSHFWTAYCCLDNNNKCKISRGFIGVNQNITPENMSVERLEGNLTTLYNVSSFKVFLLLPHRKIVEIDQ